MTLQETLSMHDWHAVQYACESLGLDPESLTEKDAALLNVTLAMRYQIDSGCGDLIPADVFDTVDTAHQHLAQMVAETWEDGCDDSDSDGGDAWED